MRSRYSDRRVVDARPVQQTKRRKFSKQRLIMALLFMVLLGTGVWHFMGNSSSRSTATTKPTTKITTLPKASTIPASTQKPASKATPLVTSSTPCDSNQLDKAIIISINKRHLWACEATHSAYDSAVVTGMENIAADLTPTGTYHVYSKQTNLYLNGSDSTGSWHDYVSYWMPFLNNQYGTYGFHDATWRAPSDFGNIDPYSDKGSHGCVELPLATAKWLFDWAAIGTTVIIQS